MIASYPLVMTPFEPKKFLPDILPPSTYEIKLTVMNEHQADFTTQMAKADLPLVGSGQSHQEYEYDMSATAAFSFSSGCLTPPLSNSSRRPSEVLFDPLDPESSFSDEIDSPIPLPSSIRQEDQTNFGHIPFEPPLSTNTPYTIGASSMSGREKLDYGDLGDELPASTELPRKEIYDWQSLAVHGEPSGPIIMGASGLFLGQENFSEPFISGQGGFSHMGFVDPNSSSSPQTILPSQTWVDPSTLFPGLTTPSERTNNVEHLPSYDYPIIPDSQKIDSYHKSDRKVLAVVVKGSRHSKLSDQSNQERHHSIRRGNSRLKSTGSRKHPSSDRDFDQWGANGNYEFKNIIAECTTVESHKSKKYLCEICPQGFDRQEHWKRHEKTATHREKLKKMDKARLGPDPPMYYCRVCQKGLNRHDNVKPHEESHLPGNGKTRRHTPIPVERSLELGMGDMDPRINPDLKKKTRKKARLH